LTSLEVWSRLSKVEPRFARYFWVIYDEFRGRPFTVEDVERVLASKGYRVENVYKLLSALREAGLLRVSIDQRDPRRHVYSISVNSASAPRAPSRDELLRLLKDAADVIRTAVDYTVILLFLFYKVVSDKWEARVEEYKAEGLDVRDAYLLANNDYIALYDVERDEVLSWSNIVRRYETLQAIDEAVVRISRINRGLEELERLANRLGLTELARGDKKSILVKLVELFNQYNFANVDYDVLGDAYQWVLGYFAPTKAKEGETYTPREVIKLMVRLLDVENNSIVVDPACGSAAMLIEAHKYVESKVGNEGVKLKLYGQEINEVMAAIAKMNLVLHGITSDTTIHVGDSLENPKFLEEVRKHDNTPVYVLANPPWNQDGYSETRLGKPELHKIYTYGYPPENTADWLWIQLMIHTSTRKVAVVIDQGSLFRGGREREIRRKIVEEDADLVEAVILLPEKLFYNTGAPGVIIVFNKSKPEERKRKVIFINASNEYKPHPEVRKLNILGEDNIEKIVKTYREYTEIPGFSKIATIEEIRKNDYNLNVTLYVTPTGGEETVDILREYEELKRIEEERNQLLKEIDYIMRELSKTLGENT
jgi:type I restriction enzyme M protein